VQRLLSTYLFVSRKLTRELLGQIADAGFTGVEIFCSRGHFDYTSKTEAQDVGAMLDSLGLTLTSLHAPTSRDLSATRESGQPLSICEVERVRRIEAMDELKRALDVAEDLPFPRMIFHMGGTRETADPRKRDAAFSSLEHLDLLFGARRLWNLRFDSCRLVDLENQILGVERQGDLPGEMIPYVYFEYLRTNEIFRLMPIFHHNAVDILTLACLTAIVPRAFHPPDQARFSHGAEMVGLARWWRQAEQHENALGLFRQAVDRGLADDLLFRTLWDIAALEKKLGRHHAALPILTDLAASRNPWRAAAFTELAKHYEHRERNCSMALEMTRKALELEPSEALRRRAARLETRLLSRKTPRLL